MPEDIKLDEDKLNEVQEREQLAREHELIADAIRTHTRVFINQTMKEMGLDISKNYNLNMETGEIKLKEEKVEE